MKPSVLTKATDPAFWHSVREREEYRPFRDDLLKKWELFAEKTFPEITYAEYCLFFESGNRSVYEVKYFERRRALNTAALLSMIYPEEKQFLARLEDIIFMICGEYTWCLPAHQPSGDVTDHIDLFASETAGALSEIYAILGHRLSPLISSLLIRSVGKRVLDSFSEGSFGWESATNNWSAVCAAGVALAFAYLRPEAFPAVLPRLESAASAFLSGYGEDGFCLEGVGYWSYGFGYYTVYADLVRDLSDGKCNGFAAPKISAIAAYLQKMFLCGNVSVSFSDGERSLSSVNVGLNHYLHREFPSAVQILDCLPTKLAEGCARFSLDLRALLWFDPDVKTSDIPKPNEVIFAPDAEWFIRKYPHYGFAAKGGHNAEPHNHNDIGSFILALDRQQIFADLGAGTYTKQYFRPETRYLTMECGSHGHSVPRFGENGQSNGRNFAARDVRADGNTFSMELAEAYRLPQLRSLCRVFTAEEHLFTLTDDFDADPNLPITERFLLLAEPTVRDGMLEVAGLTVRFGDGVKRISVDYTPMERQSVGIRRSVDAWTVDVQLAKGTSHFEMRVQL